VVWALHWFSGNYAHLDIAACVNEITCRSAPRPCSKHPWILVRDGAGCPACATQPALEHPRRRDHRPNAARRGYGHKWREYRKQYFSVPRICACGCGLAATIHNADIDHIIAVTGPSDPLFWKHSNHQPLIHDHHSRKTATHNRVSPRRGRGG
jgi:hypothetical protein